jgi:pimeloyl-ACP methyl ester carboxylesterase
LVLVGAIRHYPPALSHVHYGLLDRLADVGQTAPMRPLIVILSMAAFLYAGGCLLLFVNQRGMIYLPQPGMRGGASFTLPVAGAALAIATRELPGPKAIIYFGGNAEDVAASLPALAQAFPRHALYLMHYRGYGASTGKPTEADLHADAKVLYDHVARLHPDVSVIGRSLGSGVAVRIAAENRVAHLVLVTPYDSLATVAARQFRWFPVRALMRDKFDSFSYAPKVQAHTLVLLAKRDEIIPRASTENLLGSFRPGVASLVEIPGAGHNTISDAPRYTAAMQALLEK